MKLLASILFIALPALGQLVPPIPPLSMTIAPKLPPGVIPRTNYYETTNITLSWTPPNCDTLILGETTNLAKPAWTPIAFLPPTQTDYTVECTNPRSAFFRVGAVY